MVMNDELFLDNWRQLTRRTQLKIREYAQTPTESNQSYVVGYIAALSDCGSITDAEYWVSFVSNLAEGNRLQDAIFYAEIKG